MSELAELQRLLGSPCNSYNRSIDRLTRADVDALARQYGIPLRGRNGKRKTMTTLCRQIKYRIRSQLRDRGVLPPRRPRRGSYRTIMGRSRQKTLVPNRTCGPTIRQQLSLAARGRRNSLAQKMRLAQTIRQRADQTYGDEITAAARGLTGDAVYKAASAEYLTHILASTPTLSGYKLGAIVRAFRRLKRKRIWGDIQRIREELDKLLVKYLTFQQMCSLAQGLTSQRVVPPPNATSPVQAEVVSIVESPRPSPRKRKRPPPIEVGSESENEGEYGEWETVVPESPIAHRTRSRVRSREV